MRRFASGWLVAALVVGLAAIACEGDGLRRVRSVTYPPDFHYITRQEIRTTMGRLASEMLVLEALLGKQGGLAPEDQETVVAVLTRMEALASQLKQGAKSNHPRIDANAPRLREEIERALLSARAEPPNYYGAGRVVGACDYCHAPSLTRSGLSRATPKG